LEEVHDGLDCVWSIIVDKGIYDKMNKLTEDLLKQIQDMCEVTFYKEDMECRDRPQYRESIISRGREIKANFDSFVDELRMTLDEDEAIRRK